MTTQLFTHLFGFVFAALLGLYVVPMLIAIAHKFGITDNPDDNLKTHKQPTAYLGGLGVYISFITSMALVYPLENQITWLILGCTLLLFLGLIDDLLDLRPGQKIIGHSLAVICFLNGGIWLRHNFFASFITLPLSFLWMLTVINAFNLIDVMDGLSSVVAFCCASSFFCVALYAGHYQISLLMVVLMGAVSGFFYYNRRPARIYLGDCGSLFLGGFFAAAPLLISWSSMHDFGFLVPPALLAVPLAEVATLVMVRAYHRIPFYNGSPHHFAHYLQRRGWAITTILWFVAVVCVVATILALLFLRHCIPVLYWPALGGVGFLAWLYVVIR